MAAPLRLLTWNLGRLHLGGRWNRLLGFDSRASDDALPHVAWVIARARADIVALQELRDGAQAQRLAALLGRHFAFAIAEGEACDRRVAILARRSLAPRFSTVETAGGRAAAAATLRHEGDVWAVAALHLDAYDGAARRAQAERAAAWATGRSEPQVILAGDLNLDPRRARRANDRAAWCELSSRLGDLGASAGPTALAGRRVDHVLARGASGAATVLRGRRVPWGDHDPLRVDLRASAVAAEGRGSTDGDARSPHQSAD